MNVAPPARRGSNRSVPPCAATIPNETDNPRPVPSPGFLVVKNGRNRREPDVLGDARAVVATASRTNGAPPSRATSRAVIQIVTAPAHGADRLDGVERQVQQDLLQLAPIDVDRAAGPSGTSRTSVDPADLEAVGLQREDAVHQGRERRRVALRRSLAREVEQVLDDAPRPVGFLDEQIGVIVAQVLGQPLVPVRISWLKATIAASGLLSSWATPETSWPIASIFWAWSSSCWSRLLLCEVADDQQVAQLPADVDADDRHFFGERRAIRPDADVAEDTAPQPSDDV